MSPQKLQSAAHHHGLCPTCVKGGCVADAPVGFGILLSNIKLPMKTMVVVVAAASIYECSYCVPAPVITALQILSLSLSFIIYKMWVMVVFVSFFIERILIRDLISTSYPSIVCTKLFLKVFLEHEMKEVMKTENLILSIVRTWKFLSLFPCIQLTFSMS